MKSRRKDPSPEKHSVEESGPSVAAMLRPPADLGTAGDYFSDFGGAIRVVPQLAVTAPALPFIRDDLKSWSLVELANLNRGLARPASFLTAISWPQAGFITWRLEREAVRPPFALMFPVATSGAVHSNELSSKLGPGRFTVPRLVRDFLGIKADGQLLMYGRGIGPDAGAGRAVILAINPRFIEPWAWFDEHLEWPDASR